MRHLARRRNIQPHHDAIEVWTHGRIIFHHQRIVSRHDVIGRIGQPVQRLVPFQHFGDAIHHRKRPALLEI